MASVELTQMRRGYDGNHKRLEVSGFSPDIHEGPGLYLQVVEGCGYGVYELTLDEAERLSRILVRAVRDVRKAFAGNDVE